MIRSDESNITIYR